MPMAKAASETKKRYGKIIRFNSTASMPAMFLPANRRTTSGEKTIPSTVMTAATRASVQKSRLANSHLGLLPHVTGKHGDKGSRHGPFGNQPAEQVWDSIRQHVGIGCGGRPKEEGNALVAHVAENSADNRDQGNDRSRLENLFFFGQRAALRGPNPNGNNELTGKRA